MLQLERENALQELFLIKFNAIIQSLRPLYTTPNELPDTIAKGMQPQRAGLAAELATVDISDEQLANQMAEAFGELLIDILLKCHVILEEQGSNYAASLKPKGAGTVRTVQLTTKESNLRLMSLDHFYKVFTKENNLTDLVFMTVHRTFKILNFNDIPHVISPLIPSGMHLSNTEDVNLILYHLPEVKRTEVAEYPTYEFSTQWIIY